MSYAEIHFHLLPGIDDGPASMDESVALAAAAAAEGTRTIVATPHVHRRFVDDPRTLPDRVHEVRARLAEARIPVDVRCGGEIDLAIATELSDAQLETIAHGPHGRRWVLLESPLRGLDDDYTVVADELRARGFAVVVAHPERSFRRPEAAWGAVEHEVAAGSVLQINAWSVIGRYGERVRETAMALLACAPRTVIASDAHGEPRMPSLRFAINALERSGVAEAPRLVGAAPYELLTRGLAVTPGALAA